MRREKKNDKSNDLWYKDMSGPKLDPKEGSHNSTPIAAGPPQFEHCGNDVIIQNLKKFPMRMEKI